MSKTKTAKVSAHRPDAFWGRTQTKTVLAPPMTVPANVNVPNTPKNSSPWGDIPPDVLLEIASYICDDRYALLHLTCVCPHWRTVLVECPLNWTQISTKYPRKLFKLWLQRSQNVPIDAEICDLLPELLPLLKSNKTTFRSLRCTLNKKNLLTLFGGLTKVSPGLEKLQVCRRTADRRSPITFKIISGRMKSLKDLHLTCIDLTPEILNLRHLVNLRLEHPYPNLTAILDLIASNPLLETIALGVKCTDQTDPRPKGAITVPRLQTLKFERYSPLPLFHQLSIPTGASIAFSSWVEPEEVILPDSLEHLPNLSELRNLYVRPSSGYLIEASGPSGEVRFENVYDPRPELRRLPLQFVEKFRYSDGDPSSGMIGKEPSRGWIFEVLGRLQHLQTFVIDSCGLRVMKDIFHFLSAQTDRTRGVPPRRKSLPCSTLSTIVLEVPYDGNWNDWVVPFLQMLRGRAAAGSRLEKFRIVSRPHVQVPRHGEERRQMKKLVPWVEVKYLRYGSDGTVNERRARELFEWQYGEEGVLGGAEVKGE